MKKRLNTEKNRIEWILMNMRQEGSGLTREQIEKILGGEFPDEVEISEYILMKKLEDILTFGDKLLDLQEEFDKKTLFKFFRFISEEEPEFRKTTPVLVHLKYNPVLPQEIDEGLSDLFRTVAGKKNSDPVEKAVMLHDGIIRIYPFRNWNEIIARVALEYSLIYYGEEFCPVTLSETEYNRALTESFRTGQNDVLIKEIRAGLLMRKSIDTEE